MFQYVSGTMAGYQPSDVRRAADVPGWKHLRSAVENDSVMGIMVIPR